MDVLTGCSMCGFKQVEVNGLGPERPTVLVDGLPATVARSVLAPGYVGFYLVEFDAPQFLNAGIAELTVEAAGQLSNPVRVYTVPE